MKSKEEIMKHAREICQRDDTECAIFISGFVRGWEECLKELGYGQDKQVDQ